MFDHIQHQRERRGPNRTLLLAATAGMVGAFGLISWACLRLLSMLGFTNVIPPVEVTYDPYDDGTELRDLLGPDEVPRSLDSAVSPE